MAQLPSTVNEVEVAVEGESEISELRPYLGYSSLGHECGRYLWYTFRWCYTKKVSRRLNRLFNRGHQEEPVVVADLKRADMILAHVLDDQEALVGVMGHVRGHPDGRVINVPGATETEHSLEIKTANDKKFKEFVKFGVKRANPQYWVQTQCYMAKQKLTRVLYVITNKNTDERLYLRYHAEPEVAEEAEEKALDIISSTAPLPKIAAGPEWWGCRYCDAVDVCHRNAPIERNCRTCINSRLLDEGQWGCKVYPDAPIPEAFQRTGCKDHYKPIV